MLVAINVSGTIAFVNPDNITGVFDSDTGCKIFHNDGSTTSSTVPAESIAIMINEALVQEHVNKWQAIERARNY